MSELREHREISVAGEARSAGPARHASSRPAAGTPEWRVMLGAVAGGTFRMCRNNPGALLGGVVALGAVAAVSLNALGFQAGRHPAPILPKVAIRQDAAAVKAVPERAAEPARTAEAPRAPAKAVEAARPAARDPIADLIRSDETTASVTPKAPGAGLKPLPAVMRAQRALSKLGYGPLKPDGVMGAGTRAAIERFERDRKLPVKGEAAGRTLRELAARAGLPPA